MNMGFVQLGRCEPLLRTAQQIWYNTCRSPREMGSSVMRRRTFATCGGKRFPPRVLAGGDAKDKVKRICR